MSYSDFDYNTAKQINNSLAKVLAIKSLLSGNDLTIDELYTLKGIKIVNDFLETPVNSREESNFKKAFVSSVISSIEFGQIHLSRDYTTEELTILVSEGLTRLKSLYHAEKEGGKGTDVLELLWDHMIVSLLKSVEETIDDWCSRLPEQMEELTDEYYEDLVTVLSTAAYAVISLFASPDTALDIEPLIREVAMMLKPTVKVLVKQGTEAILQFAKNWLIGYEEEEEEEGAEVLREEEEEEEW